MIATTQGKRRRKKEIRLHNHGYYDKKQKEVYREGRRHQKEGEQRRVVAQWQLFTTLQRFLCAHPPQNEGFSKVLFVLSVRYLRFSFCRIHLKIQEFPGFVDTLIVADFMAFGARQAGLLIRGQVFGRKVPALTIWNAVMRIRRMPHHKDLPIIATREEQGLALCALHRARQFKRELN